MKLVLFRTLVISLSLVPAFAGTIEIIARGHVAASGASSIPVGTTLTAHVFFDPAYTPLSTYSFGEYDSAAYLLPSPSILVFGSSIITGELHQLNVATAVPLGTPVCCIRGGYDGMEWASLVTAVTGPFAADPIFDLAGLNPFYITFQAPHSDGVLASTMLPSTFPSFPGHWTEADFFLAFGGGISGPIESVTVVTPEPGTLSLLALTLLTGLLFKINHSRLRQRTRGSLRLALGFCR